MTTKHSTQTDALISIVVPTGWQHEFEDDPMVLSAVSETGNPLVQPSTVTAGEVDENWFHGNLGVTLIVPMDGADSST